jgi:hypothetical protein
MRDTTATRRRRTCLFWAALSAAEARPASCSTSRTTPLHVGAKYPADSRARSQPAGAPHAPHEGRATHLARRRRAVPAAAGHARRVMQLELADTRCVLHRGGGGSSVSIRQGRVFAHAKSLCTAAARSYASIGPRAPLRLVPAGQQRALWARGGRARLQPLATLRCVRTRTSAMASLGVSALDQNATRTAGL